MRVRTYNYGHCGLICASQGDRNSGGNKTRIDARSPKVNQYDGECPWKRGRCQLLEATSELEKNRERIK